MLQKNMAKKFAFCPEYKALCLGQILKHGGCIMLWVCLSSARTKEGFILYKRKQNTAKHRQNPRRKPGSVIFPTDTGRRIQLSAGQ
jgi:hypothetical protein